MDLGMGKEAGAFIEKQWERVCEPIAIRGSGIRCPLSFMI